MMATYDEWLDAFSEAYDEVPNPPSATCPNCGHASLRLVFTGDPDRMVGYAHFWCDNCLQGIGISRTTVPDGATTQNIHTPRAQRSPQIPNYHLIN